MSARPVLTDALIRAAASDAGDRSMRAGGRTGWSLDDYHAAAREYARLSPVPEGARPTTPYRLPDGQIVQMFEDVARGAPVLTFQLAGGRVVNAVRLPSEDQ